MLHAKGNRMLHLFMDAMAGELREAKEIQEMDQQKTIKGFKDSNMNPNVSSIQSILICSLLFFAH